MDAAMQNLDAILALQPTDLDALRLKERIIQQTSPEDYQRLERIRINQIRDQSR
jgi:uncharacterized protein HemY